MGDPRRSPDPALLEELRDLTPEEFALWVEETGRSDEEAEDVRWWIQYGNRYQFRPVPVREFLFGRAFMRALDEVGEPVLWPKVVEAVEAICNGDYIEAVLTGSIGVAKTTVGLYCHAYKLYDLLCMRNPHATYGLDPTSEIGIVFQSLNRDLAMDVDYTRFKSMIDRAPVFSTVNFRYDREIKSQMRFPKKVVVKPVAGLDTGALGQNILSAQVDEISRMALVQKSKRARDKELYDQAVALYNSIARRRESRFMDLGHVPGILTLVGSREVQDDFLHRKIDEAMDRPDRIYLYDKVIWDVKPWAFGKKRFRVFAGDPTRKPRILKEGEKVPQKDQDLVRHIPMEYLHQFEVDIMGALREIAGVSTTSIHPFFLNRDLLSSAFGKVRSVLSREGCDFEETNIRFYPSRWAGTREFPRFAHLDLARSRDSAGLAIGHVRGFRKVKRSEMVEELLPVVRFDALLEVRPPKGGEIQFEKIRTLLYKLREHGLPIKWVTADQYQSSDTLQILGAKGFLVGEESADKTSGPDKTSWPYEILKGGVYDQRVEMPEHEKCHTEMLKLERDPTTGKVDHGPLGSKDVSDAAACVVIGLSLQAEIWNMFRIPFSEVPATLESAASHYSSRDVEGKM